jgi:hypothetical protein
MKLLLPFTAPLFVALVSCSHPAPDSDSAGETTPDAHKTAARTAGTRVDSLNGIPGHRFGEPLSSFPSLIAAENGQDGMKRYYYTSTRPVPGTGWFAKHNKDFDITYFFFDGKFATVIVTAYGQKRQLLSKEAIYLFGLGERYQLDGAIWQGQQAHALYINTFTPLGAAARLEIVSEPLATLEKQQAANRLKADNEQK